LSQDHKGNYIGFQINDWQNTAT